MSLRWNAAVGLRSRLARRVLLLVLAASLLPVSLAGVLTYRHLQSQAEERSRAEIEMGARYLGLGLLADLQRTAAELGAILQEVHFRGRADTVAPVPGLLVSIELHEVVEDDAIYYIAEFGVNDGDMLDFAILVKPENGATVHEIKLRQKFYTR